MDSVALRPVAGEDRPFLVELYGSTREGELALVPWDADTRRAFVEQQFTAQDNYYRANYDGATFDVIEVGGKPAGRLYVHQRDDDIRIMDITLAPAFRGRGIGTGLLQALLEEGAANGRTVSIHVELNNPAKRLYERLGFRAAGEPGVYVLMIAS